MSAAARPALTAGRWRRLATAAVAIACLWLVVLPGLADVPSIRNRLLRLERQQVNAGAMYYTELEAMPRILEKLQRRGGSLFGTEPAASPKN